MSKVEAFDSRLLGGSHGNEPVGLLLCDKLDNAPLPHIQHRRAHPELVIGRRSFGKIQIMGKYPGKPDGDPEERAADKNMQWLGDAVGDPRVVVFDVHNSTVPGHNYCGVGMRASQRALIAAHELEHNRVILATDGSLPFHASVPNAVALENSIAKEHPVEIADRLYKKLADLTEIDPSTYKERADTFEFYRVVDICSTGKDGLLRPGLEVLEAIPAQEAFTVVDLSHIDEKIRDSFGLTETLIMETWGHNNMSMEDPNLGHTDDGRQRKSWFGSYYIRINPPKIDGEWVVFDSFQK